MFKKSCHLEGKAIRIETNLIVFCHCLTVDEIQSVFNFGRQIEKEKKTK